LEELKHNRVIEDHGIYFAPYKHERKVTLEEIKKIKKNIKQLPKIPNGVIINVQLQQLAKRIRIPYFRGIFILRITLPTGRIYRNKSGIVNLDNDGPGIHYLGTRSGEIVLFTLIVSAIFNYQRN